MGAGRVYAKCPEIWSPSVVTMEACAIWRPRNKRMVCLETQRWEPLELCHRDRGESLSCNTSQYSWSHILDIQVTFKYLLSKYCKISWSDYQGQMPRAWDVMGGLSDPIECDPMSLSANGCDLCPCLLSHCAQAVNTSSDNLITWGSPSIFTFTVYNQWVSC